MSEKKIKEYSNDEITVFWNAEICMHSANCVRGLPEVFNTNASPWINVNGANAKTIKHAIDKCPSGALSYKKEGEEDIDSVKIEATENGPYAITGDFGLINSDGSEVSHKQKVYLCRCGGSGNKPFCDGSHKKNGFEG